MGHSGGVPSAVEAPPAGSANLTKSSERAALARVNSTAPVGRLTAASLKRRLMLADGASLVIGFAIATTLAMHRSAGLYVGDHVLLWLSSLPFFVCGAGLAHLYVARANQRSGEESANVVKAVGVSVGGLVLIAFFLHYQGLSRFWVITLAVSTSLALMVERAIARRVFTRLRQQGKLRRPIVIVGTDANAVRLLHTFQRRPDLGYEVLGFVGSEDIGERGGVGVLGTLDEIERVLAQSGANGVVVSPSLPEQEINGLARKLTDLGYHVALSSSLRDIDMNRLRPQQFDGHAMLYIEPVIRHGWRGVAKRAFDVSAACAVLIISSPILLAGMVATRIQGKGPVFFRQVRVGVNGDPFTMTKLRTMVLDAEERKAALLEHNEMDGPLFKMANDPRITPVGRWLRKLSIDELPQLFSVVQGSMSMVGPRPALPEEAEQWDEQVQERLRVRPGITGMWQVSGRSSTSFEDYKRLDLYYVDNWSLSHDLRICAKTVGVVLTGKGAA